MVRSDRRIVRHCKPLIVIAVFIPSRISVIVAVRNLLHERHEVSRRADWWKVARANRIRVVRSAAVQLHLKDCPVFRPRGSILETKQAQCDVSRSRLSQSFAQIRGGRRIARATRLEYDCHAQRTSAPFQLRHSSRSELGAERSREYQRRGTPGSVPGSAAHSKERMAGGMASARDLLHGSDNALWR